MSTYTQELAKRIREQNEIGDIYKERQAAAQASYDAALGAFKSGGDIYSLDDSARAMYRNIESELARKRREEQERLKAEREQMSWLERTGHTLGDFFGQSVGGVMKFGENVVDYFGTMLGADEDWVKRDWTQELYMDKLREGTKGSYLYDGDFGSMVQSSMFGLGNMLPSVALNFVPYVGTALSAGSFMTNAAGGSTERALQEGASRDKALLYGTLSGISEGAIEKVSGGIGGLGKGVLQSVAKSAGKSAVAKGVLGTAKKYAGRMLGKGLEEVASDALDPLLRAAYTGKVDYSGVSAGSLADTFGIGAMTSGLMLGGQAVAHNATAANRVRTRLAELNEIKAGLDERYYKGKLTEAQYRQGLEDVNWLAGKAVKTLSGISENRAEKVVKRVGEARLENVGIERAEGGFRANTANPGEYNYKAMTPSLANKVDSLAFKPTSAELTPEQESLVKEYGKLNNGKAGIVFTDEIGAVTEDGRTASANGAYSDGVIYISRSAVQPIREVMKHEFTHALEGSRAYGEYAEFVLNEIRSSATLQKEYGDLMTELAETAEQYEGVTESGSDILSEVVARYTERIFSDPRAVTRLARANKGLARRVLGLITDRLSALGKGKANAATRKFLLRAESLYRKAIAAKPSRLIASNGNTANEKENTQNIEVDSNILNTANIAVTTEKPSKIVGNQVNIDVKRNISENAPKSIQNSQKIAPNSQNINANSNLVKNIQFNIKKYNNEERKFIEYDKRNSVLENQYQLQEFILNSKLKLDDKKLYLGKINDSAAEIIKKDTNFNVSNFNIVLDSDNIRHIFKKHENINEYKRGQIPITINNFSELIETITNPSMAYLDNNALVLTKVLDGKVIVITVISNKKKNITLKSARIINKKTAPTTDSAEAFSPTSETGSSLAVSNNSISKTNANVNTIAENSLKNDNNKVKSQVNIDVNSNIPSGNVNITLDKKGNNVKYSIGKSFAEQIDEVIEGRHDPNIDIYVSKTPKLLIELGFKNTALLMKSSKISDILEKHKEMNLDIIKNIPNAIENPLLILKSKTNPNESVVVISEINTEKGNLIIPVWMNVEGQYYDIELEKVVSDKFNFVASAYGRNIKTLLEYAANNNEILYYDKSQIKKVSQLFNTHGLQLPAPLNMTNFNNSIFDSDTNVNNSAENSLKNQNNTGNKTQNTNEADKLNGGKDIKFSLSDSEGTPISQAQAEFFKDSEVRDGDGKLLAVYHGTPYGKFYKFAGKKLYFFSKNKDFATEYAEMKAHDEELDSEPTIVKAYLNAKKLFDINNKRDFEFLKNNLPDKIGYGFGGLVFDKNDYLELLKGNKDVLPIWTKEQIKNAVFGKQIGKTGRAGHSDDVFVGIDSQNNVVYVDRHSGKYLKYLSAAEVNNLRDGESVKVKYYKNYAYGNEISEAEYNLLNTEETFYYVPRYEGIMPQKAAQEITHLTGQDNWTYVELSLIDNGGNLETLIDVLKRAGYDGIKITENGVENYAVYNSNQIKLTTNKTPTRKDDIRFSLARDSKKAKNNGEISLSVEEKEALNKAIKAIKDEEIARAHIKKVIKSLRVEIDGKIYRAEYNDKYFAVSLPMLNEALRGLKTNSTAGLDELSRHILNAVELYDEGAYKLKNSHSQSELNKISQLLSRAKRDGIRLSGSLIDANDSPIVKEYCRADGSITLTRLVNQLKELGVVVRGRTLINKLQNLDKLYKTVSDSKRGLKLNAVAPKLLKRLQRVISNRLIKRLDKSGAMIASVNAIKNIERADKLIEQEKAKSDARIARAKEIEKQSYEREKMEAPIIQIKDVCARFKEYADRNYRTGTILAMPDMDGIIRAFNKITWVRGLRSNKFIHEALMRLQSFIKANKNAAEVVLGFSSEIVEKIDNLVMSTRLKPYDTKPDRIQTKKEVDDLLKIVKAVDYLFKYHHAIVLDGVSQEASVLTSTAINELNYASNYNKGINAVWMKESVVTSDPRTIYTMVSGAFDDGNVIMRLFDDLVASETVAKLTAIELIEPVENFFEDNKSYKKDIYSKRIKIADATIELGQAIMIYMQAKQEGVIDRLAITGAYGKDAKGRSIDLKSITAKDIAAIESQLTATDFELIKLIESTFKQAGEIKYEADVNLNGYSDINPGKYYVPLVVEGANLAQSYTSMSQWTDEFNERNYGFNNHRNPLATKQLKLVNIYDELYRHCRDLGVYARLTQAFRNFDQLMNYNINLGNPDSKEVITLKSYINKNIWSGFDKYQLEFFADIRGDNRQNHSAVIDWLRNNWIVARLGFNIKSYISQFSGLAMGAVNINFKHLAKGVAKPMSKERFLEYGGYAKVRTHERAAVRAAGFEGKMGKYKRFSTIAIQMADNYMMREFMTACESQIEEQLGHKVESRADMDLVCEFFERTVRETQSSDMMSERSALQRHRSDTLRTLATFKSDAIKMVSNVKKNIFKISAAKKFLKANPNSERGIKALKEARKRLRRSIMCMTVSNAIYVGIALLFSWLLRKRDEEGKKWDAEDYGKAFGMGMLESFVGMYPLIGDIFNKVTSGYDIEQFSYSMINDLVDSTVGVYGLVEKRIKGEEVSRTELMKALRNAFYSASELLGLPTRNLFKYTKMIVNWFDESAMYKHNSLFYSAKKSDLDAAIEEKNDGLAESIFMVMFAERGYGDMSEASMRKLLELYKAVYKDGISVIPSKAPVKVTWKDANGEEQEKQLTAADAAVYRANNAEAAKAVEKLLKSGEYAAMGEKEKAAAVKRIYSYYNAVSKVKVTGVEDINTQMLLASLLSVEDMAVLMTKNANLAADTYANGKTVPDSKKRKLLKLLNSFGLTFAEKELVRVLLGYSPSNPKTIKQTIRRSKLSSKEKEKLLEKYTK